MYNESSNRHFLSISGEDASEAYTAIYLIKNGEIEYRPMITGCDDLPTLNLVSEN